MRLCGKGMLVPLSCLLADRASMTVLFSKLIQPVQREAD